MILSPVIRQRFYSANGAPLAGGKLFSYIAGTTTPQATYTDQGSGTPNTNPVILDANGEANVWVDPSLVYKFILQDANGVVQWTVDSVYPPGGIAAFVGDTGTGGGGGLVPAPAAGDAAANKFLKASGAWAQFRSPTIQSFASTGTTSGYVFTVSGIVVAPTAGSTYTNNGNTYTVVSIANSNADLYCTQASAPLASGTLTKTAGTGDATISFSAIQALANYITPVGLTSLRVRMAGGGGGGGGSGTATGGTGANGLPSYFSAGPLKADGGLGRPSGGISGPGLTTSSLGTASGKILRGVPGGAGRVDATGTSGNSNAGGTGGPTPWAGGAGSGGFSTIGSSGVANTGGGGGGAGLTAAGAATTSGAGGSSGCFVEAIIASPTGTYLYAVGTGGVGGTAGTGGSAGGAGGSGFIEVTEF